MMALPNSRFGEMLRKNLHRKGNNWDVSSHEAGAATALSLAPFRSATHSDSDNFQVIFRLQSIIGLGHQNKLEFLKYCSRLH